MKHAANLITLSRAVGAAILLCLNGIGTAFWVIYIFCGFTDMIDGRVARHTGTAGARGAVLDTAADAAFLIACLVRLLPAYHLKPWVWLWICGIAAVRLACICVRGRRGMKILVPHSLLNRITGGVLFCFPLLARAVDVRVLSAFACAAAAAAALYDIAFIGREQ